MKPFLTPRGLSALCAAVVLSVAGCVARPPAEPGPFYKPDLVELKSSVVGFHLDIRYATTNNFLGRAVYRQSRAFLQRAAADSLVHAHASLASEGYGIAIFDGYRPWRVTKDFWDSASPQQRPYVADPSKGSRHNRGCAVDCTLYDLKTGREVEMPSAYDEPTERSHPDYTGGTPESRRLRDLLRSAMEREGYKVIENEWWHFDFNGWEHYPLLDVPFERFP